MGGICQGSSAGQGCPFPLLPSNHRVPHSLWCSSHLGRILGQNGSVKRKKRAPFLLPRSNFSILNSLQILQPFHVVISYSWSKTEEAAPDMILRNILILYCAINFYFFFSFNCIEFVCQKVTTTPAMVLHSRELVVRRKQSRDEADVWSAADLDDLEMVRRTGY